jgi:hypothetical protein
LISLLFSVSHIYTNVSLFGNTPENVTSFVWFLSHQIILKSKEDTITFLKPHTLGFQGAYKSGTGIT